MTRPANPGLVSAILRSASDLFAEHGPNGVTLKEVARQVGVTTTTLHYYFDDRKGLMKAVTAAALAELAEALAANAHDAPAAEQLLAAGRAFADWVCQAPPRYALVFPVTSAGAADADDPFSESAAARHILHARLQEILERGRRRDELAFDDAELQTSLALCWLAGVAVVESSRALPTDLQPAAGALLNGALSAFLAPISRAATDIRPEARQIAEVAEIRPRRPAEAHALSDDELDRVAAAGLQEGSLLDFRKDSP